MPAFHSALRWAAVCSLIVLSTAALLASRKQEVTRLVLTYYSEHPTTQAHYDDDVGAACAGCAADEQQAPLPPAVLRSFAVATSTADFRHGLSKAMRGWRRGIRTLILTNATGAALARERAEGRRFHEAWHHFPDVRGFNVTRKQGDPRAAMAPALALAALGRDIKWLVYADDDVAVFWPGLLRMLRGLNPEDPYFITDNYYSHWPEFGLGPSKLSQPRCVPCTLDTRGLDLKKAHALKTCNCSVAAMAGAFQELLGSKKRPFKHFPNNSPINAIAGGGGAVLSIGLLRRLNVTLYESCILGRETASWGPAQCGGGDCLVTKCLWHQGFGYTDPGFELRHPGMLIFNADQELWTEMHLDFADALAGGCRQGSPCRLSLDHRVTAHTMGRHMRNYTQGAARVRRFLRAASKFSEQAGLRQLAAQLVL